MPLLVNKRKRILIINYEFPPLGGGGGVASHDLAVEWGKENMVDVLTSAYLDTPLYEKMGDVNVHRVKVWNRKSRDAASFISMLTYLIFGLFKGISLMRKSRYDVINTHFALPSGPLGWILGALYKVPNILSLHGGDIYDPSKKSSPHNSIIFRNIVKFILWRASVIVAQSSNTRDNTIKYYNPKKEIKIIPLAFRRPVEEKDPDFSPGAAKDDFVLVTIGRIVKRKSIETMINALAQVKSKKVKLFIIGDGPERENLQTLIYKRKLQNSIKIIGFVDEKTKYRYLRRADLFIMTSLHEGFGIVFMEAMYCGKPIISANHGGQTDFLTHGTNALLIDVGDVKNCALSIEKLMRDKSLYRKLAQNNSKDVKKFYAGPVAMQYEELMNALGAVK
jgi:L-malate glycosyltransferase